MVRVALASLLFLLVGCDDAGPGLPRSLETEDQDFRQGQLFQKQGESRKALECYLKVIDARRGSAESHLEAGRLCSELNDPLPAIYHYHQYIRLKPTSEQRKIVEQMIRTAEKQYMQQLPGRPMEPDAVGSGDLQEQLRKLRTENDKLKREITDLTRGQPRAANTPANPVTPPVAVATPERPVSATPVAPAATPGRAFATYVVGRNDNLSSISRKAYGTSARANDILRANSTQISSPNALKIGMTLVIPE
jgi:tetratricopeptide (TPR) repeat protein